MGKRPDPRTESTKMRIKKALLEYLCDSPFERITVKNICDSAGIDRSTFYPLQKPLSHPRRDHKRGSGRRAFREAVPLHIDGWAIQLSVWDMRQGPQTSGVWCGVLQRIADGEDHRQDLVIFRGEICRIPDPSMRPISGTGPDTLPFPAQRVPRHQQGRIPQRGKGLGGDQGPGRRIHTRRSRPL